MGVEKRLNELEEAWQGSKTQGGSNQEKATCRNRQSLFAAHKH